MLACLSKGVRDLGSLLVAKGKAFKCLSLQSQGCLRTAAAGCVRHVQACLSEGMRVYPPVPTLTREAERDMELGGYRIEKGTMLGVAVYSMHNNPAYWNVSIQRPGYNSHSVLLEHAIQSA